MTKEVLIFFISWRRVEKLSGRKPDTIVVGSDSMASTVRRWLNELNLEANVIADNELIPKTYLITHTSDMAQMPGTEVDSQLGYPLGGGKN